MPVLAQYIVRDAVGYPDRSLPHGVVRQVGVTRRRLDPAVAEQPADRWQGLAERQGPGGEAVP